MSLVRQYALIALRLQACFVLSYLRSYELQIDQRICEQSTVWRDNISKKWYCFRVQDRKKPERISSSARSSPGELAPRVNSTFPVHHSHQPRRDHPWEIVGSESSLRCSSCSLSGSWPFSICHSHGSSPLAMADLTRNRSFTVRFTLLSQTHRIQRDGYREPADVKSAQEMS